MAKSPKIEPFDKSKHDRKNFDCGTPALNNYLRAQLRQDTDRGVTFREAMTEAAVQWIKASKRKRLGPPVRYRLADLRNHRKSNKSPPMIRTVGR